MILNFVHKDRENFKTLPFYGDFCLCVKFFDKVFEGIVVKSKNFYDFCMVM